MISNNKSSTIILIAVRLKSKRLKNKALLPINDIPMILLLHNRLLKSKLASKIVWCTSTHKDDDRLYSLAKKNNIICVRGSELNVLSRFSKAIKLFKAKNIVRVTGDNPLTDPKIIDKMILVHEKNQNDYTFCNSIPNGSRSEVISAKAIQYCLKNITEPNNSEYMTWMFNRPDIYKIQDYKLTNKSLNFPNINFTVDSKNEYKNIVRIFNNFKNNNFALSDAIKFVKSDKKLINLYLLSKKVNKKTINVMYKFEKDE